MLQKNICLNTDSYKSSHFLQYPKGTSYVSSYIEPRSGGKYDKVVFFGLQGFLQEYLVGNVLSEENISEAAAFYIGHGEPFNKEGWNYILNNYKGKLPIEIEAVPEGTVLDVGNVLVQIRNTDPKCYWLTSFLETALLRAIWYPTTVATISWHAKKIIYDNLLKTSDDPEGQILFKLHDFGARGVSSNESAAIGGAAHLINFLGSDTVEGVRYLNHHYNKGNMSGFSIPAAEHSTITTWGRNGELDAFRNMLTQFGGLSKLVAVVSDSYNITHAVKEYWGQTLRSEVKSSGGTVVVRPDSGDPVKVAPDVVEMLGDSYGTTLNSKGYKVLHPSIRVIQGDGVNLKSIKEILNALKERGYSGDNIAFGMGGELLQKCNRDTLRFAMKCNWAFIDGKEIEVYKDPVTDPGKRSKQGILSLIRENGKYITIKRNLLGQRTDYLEPIYYNGMLLKTSSLDEIRNRSNI